MKVLDSPARRLATEAEAERAAAEVEVRMASEGHGEPPLGSCCVIFQFRGGNASGDRRRWFCGEPRDHQGRHAAIVLGKRRSW